MIGSQWRRDILIALIAIAGVLIYVAAAGVAGGVGFPLDDAWIHQVYGRNLGLTGQWAFVPGVLSTASTSPLYTVLLAIGYALRINYQVWTYGLGAIGLAACAMIAGRLADQVYPTIKHAGLLTGIAVALAWHFVWIAAAGMETIIFCALTLALFGVLWRRIESDVYMIRAEALHGALFGIVGAFTTLARPEGAILVALCGLILVAIRPNMTIRGAIVWTLCAGAAYVVVLAPYLIFNLGVTGSPLPNTSPAKQAETAPLRIAPITQRIIEMIAPLTAGAQLIVLPGFAAALYQLTKRLRADRRTMLYMAAPLWIVVLVLLYAWRLPAPYQHGRYVIPALAPFFVIAGGGLLTLTARRYRGLAARVVSRTLMVTAIVGLPVFWAIGLGLYVQEVRLIEGEMVLAARWIATNVPPGERMATHDIGAIGFFAPRPLFDLAGLVSPEVIPIITDPPALMKLMEQQNVRFLMASRVQLPTVPDDPRLCVVFETPGAETPVHMRVYRIAWNGVCQP